MKIDSDKTPQYYLCKHIFPCEVDGHIILLDLHKDTYALVGEDLVSALQYFLRAGTEQSDDVPKGYNRSLDTLVEQGVLTKNSIEGERTVSTMQKQSIRDMKGYPFDGNPPVSFRHVFNCLRAVIYAKFMRRCYSIERIVNRVATRRSSVLAKRAEEQEIHPMRVWELVEVYRIIRVLFYTPADHCLFDSLATIEFLSIYGIYPYWIFGVRMGPFGAHCWVQDSTFIYNDTVTHTHYYKPIMSV